MTDEITPQAPEMQPAPPPTNGQLGYDPEVSRKHGAFYAEKPEALRVALDEYEKRTGEKFIPRSQYDSDMQAIKEELAANRREKLLTKALLANGLAEEHARFIHGDTAEELNEAAAAFAALLPKGDSTDNTPKPAPKPKAPAPEPRYKEEPPSPPKRESLQDILAEANTSMRRQP